ncbi:hypothetical protein [Paenibacillus pinihumi]|uniref:hypothetical protein n=1 Tax=Paenibacillus pinihumi TaxID=669462 RepID=UPI0003FFD4F6|nr:hypothetical protein [Paenibacillus pinihumi]
MTTTNQWAIREVAIAHFFDIATGGLKVKLDSLKQSGLENTSDIVYSQGGRGNTKIVGFSGNKAARFTLQDAVFTNDMVAMLTGNELVTAAAPVIKEEVLTVQGGTVTLSCTPRNPGKLLSVNALGNNKAKGKVIQHAAATPALDQYTVSGKKVTFGENTFADGDKVQIYMETLTAPDAKKITSSTDKFAGTYKLVLDCLVRDVYTEKDFAAQIVVHKAKIEDNWNLTMSPDGDPSVLDIPMEALRSSDSTELYTMTIYDETTIV